MKKKEPFSGEVTVRRKMDKVQLVREPNVVLATLTAELALALAEIIEDEASKILQATASEE